MKRRNGLDSMGRPMTVRGGIADIMRSVRAGRVLIVYSRGRHHIQAPGDRLPLLFKDVQARMEVLDIADYCRQLGIDGDEKAFQSNVIRDLTERRDRLLLFSRARK